jgi:hypothetical protein
MNEIQAIAKGKNLKQWHDHLELMQKRFKYVSMMDMSSFESHCSSDALLFVHKMENKYAQLTKVNNLRSRTFYSKDHPNGIKTVYNKIANRDKTIRITAESGLMSGDFDTAFTGTLISVVMVLMVMEDIGKTMESYPDGTYPFEFNIVETISGVDIQTKDWCFYDNGDDIVVFTDRILNPELVKSTYSNYGFLSRFDGQTDIFEGLHPEDGVQFCRHFPHKGQMIRDIHRIVSNNLQCNTNLTPVCALTLIMVKTYANVLMYGENPVLGPYFKRLCNALYDELHSLIPHEKYMKLIRTQFNHNLRGNWWYISCLESNNIYVEGLLSILENYQHFTAEDTRDQGEYIDGYSVNSLWDLHSKLPSFET